MTENIVVNFIANVKGFSRAMAAPMERMKEIRTATGKWDRSTREANTRLGRLTLGFRKAVHGMRGFKMEMLSVMFFGQGMTRFFSGLLRPALEATGLFKLWGIVLQVLFLPIALKLLEILMPIFQWIMNLDEATKLIIGKWVLFGIVAGLFLFLLGSIALGIGGVILVFGSLFGIIDKLIPDIDVLGINMSSFLEAGLAIGLISKLW
ncbi:hypothetical protein LCGC14_2722990, partial [marine sediment metagenome]